MSTGLWNTSGVYDGSSPAHPDPWSRWYEGWVTPTQIPVAPLVVRLPAIETSPTVFQLLDNPNGVDWLFDAHSGTGEYFLVENRQKLGFDVGIPGSGLLIWHIDEGVSFYNDANANANHRLVDLEQADGLRQLNITSGGNAGDAGDPFPGSTVNQAFTATSNPNSNLYSGLPSGVTITNISYWFYFPQIGKTPP